MFHTHRPTTANDLLLSRAWVLSSPHVNVSDDHSQAPSWNSIWYISQCHAVMMCMSRTWRWQPWSRLIIRWAANKQFRHNGCDVLSAWPTHSVLTTCTTAAQIICIHISMYSCTNIALIPNQYLRSRPCDMALKGSFSERPFWVLGLRMTSTPVWLRGPQLQLHSSGCTQSEALQS